MRLQSVLAFALFPALVTAALLVPAAVSAAQDTVLTVAETPSRARAADGTYISWAEHLIDSEDINGGLPIRGGDGLKMADIDGDGFADVVSVHEDSNHLRIAFGSADPDRWTLVTLGEGAIAAAAEDVAIGDINGDGRLDLFFACEEGHLVYYQNPGEGVRSGRWPHVIPAPTRGRGSWLRVFLADVDRDGQLDVLAANKGGSDVIDPQAGEPLEGTTSLLTLHGDPLAADSWREQVLLREGVPNIALPVDIDSDGDADVLAASRLENRLFLVENLGPGAKTKAGANKATNALATRVHEISIAAGFATAADWSAGSSAFHAAVSDLNGDGRQDLVLVVMESVAGKVAAMKLGWLAQPATLDAPWRYHRIGDFLPDWLTGYALADIDGDGDLDVMVGGYSGVNVLAGAYSGASRDYDDPRVTPSDSTGRLAWFENPGATDGAGDWPRHDIARRVRGMYDEFLPRDMDGDGDLDFVATRGNAGSFDGVFWLEQRRSAQAEPAFAPARQQESRHLPLPPADWRAHYDPRSTRVAPNKRAAAH
ncbi:FG-GAP repeat domain-containing protein [Parahaliea mediterranea]|uniref:FG-GAP repeat domain-containing protein n=1 Tax=Parahaliea mediterranea TaxID=651086 RepID=UPI001F4DF629|nr:VCBS repeat-containing protein [Parahaliea mediterranea]